jgi:HlyD family secretion protein
VRLEGYELGKLVVDRPSILPTDQPTKWQTKERTNKLTTKRRSKMKSKKVWIGLIALVTLVAAGYIYQADILSLMSGLTGSTASAQTPDGFDPENLTTTAIRPAGEAAGVSAAGNIQLSSQRPVVLEVEGIVTQVAVEVGDQVAVDDLLVALDTTDLARAVAQAELKLADAQAQLDKLLEPADPADIASAEASLSSALGNLAEVQAGPSAAELAAAEANLAAAQARYQELLAGPSQAELTQLSADLEKSLIDLQQAQWDYDQVAYAGEGASSQAAALQQATINYEAGVAAFEIAVEPASQAELQEAQSAIQSAQEQVDTLRAQPTQADLAAAEAQVASAQAQLEELLGDPGQAELRAAEISVEQAQLDLEETETELAKAQLVAPIDGTALSVDVEVGEKVQAGFSAVTLANLNALELTVNVAEVDIGKVYPDQRAEITVDALPDEVFSGVVARIAPSSQSESGVVNYPVTIQLTNTELTGVRPGMTAVADILGEDMADSWLVPTSAVRELEGQTVVMILRDGQPTPVTVTSQGTQGEWTVAQSPELQEGDQALGAVSSFLNEDESPAGFERPGGGTGLMRPQ